MNTLTKLLYWLSGADKRIAELEKHLSAETENYDLAVAGRVAAELVVGELTTLMPCGHPAAALASEDGATWCEWCASLAAARSGAEAEWRQRVADAERRANDADKKAVDLAVSLRRFEDERYPRVIDRAELAERKLAKAERKLDEAQKRIDRLENSMRLLSLWIGA